MRMVEIGNGRLRAVIDAKRGGCLLRLDAVRPGGQLALLRSADEAFAITGDPLRAAAFVTAPHFGPVTGGGIDWAGRRWPILRNHPDEPEPIHGDAWLRPWAVEGQEASAATLAYTHVPAPGTFPAPYRIAQTCRIDGVTLSVRLSLRNLADAPILAGMAWHPYFPLRPGTRLGLAAEALWSRRPLEETVPFGPVPESFRFDPPREFGHLVADDTYEGWSGRVTIGQEDHLLRMQADPCFGKLQLFAPEGAGYLCVEPATNAPDARRLAMEGVGAHGLATLAPGEALEGTVSLTFEDHG
jgi:aldose 1-epimerase